MHRVQMPFQDETDLMGEVGRDRSFLVDEEDDDLWPDSVSDVDISRTENKQEYKAKEESPVLRPQPLNTLSSYDSSSITAISSIVDRHRIQGRKKGMDGEGEEKEEEKSKGGDENVEELYGARHDSEKMKQLQQECLQLKIRLALIEQNGTGSEALRAAQNIIGEEKKANRELLEENAKLKDQIKSLKTEVRNKSRALDDKESLVDRLSEQIGFYEDDIKHRDTIIGELQQENVDLSSLVRDNQSSRSSPTRVNSSSLDRLREMDRRLWDMRSSDVGSQNLATIISDLCRKLEDILKVEPPQDDSSIQGNTQWLVDLVEAVGNDYNELVTFYTSVFELILNEDKDDENATAETVIEIIRDLITQNEFYKESHDDIMKTCDSLRSRLEGESHNTKISELDASYKALQKDFAGRTSEIAKLLAKRNIQCNDKDEINQLESLISTIEKTNEDLLKRLSDNNKEEEQATMRQLKDDLTKIIREKKSLEVRVNNMALDIEDLAKEKREIETKLAEAEFKLSSISEDDISDASDEEGSPSNDKYPSVGSAVFKTGAYATAQKKKIEELEQSILLLKENIRLKDEAIRDKEEFLTNTQQRALDFIVSWFDWAKTILGNDWHKRTLKKLAAVKEQLSQLEVMKVLMEDGLKQISAKLDMDPDNVTQEEGNGKELDPKARNIWKSRYDEMERKYKKERERREQEYNAYLQSLRGASLSGQ